MFNLLKKKKIKEQIYTYLLDRKIKLRSLNWIFILYILKKRKKKLPFIVDSFNILYNYIVNVMKSNINKI